MCTGGSRSGKSRHALTLAEPFQQKAFIATAEPLDGEMQDRISKHKQDRGSAFLVREEPINLADAIQTVPAKVDLILIDCLTVWVGNLMHHLTNEKDIDKKIQAFLKILQRPPCSIIVVTNEVGLGIIPAQEMARRFRDRAGWLNQEVARLADKVILLISGIPMTIKGN